jgi:hypothetical protein
VTKVEKETKRVLLLMLDTMKDLIRNVEGGKKPYSAELADRIDRLTQQVHDIKAFKIDFPELSE